MGSNPSISGPSPETYPFTPIISYASPQAYPHLHTHLHTPMEIDTLQWRQNSGGLRLYQRHNMVLPPLFRVLAHATRQ